MSNNGITWQNSTVRLGDLKPWPRNPRQIKADQAKRLAESFDTFGQVETVAIGPDGEVYNGHQRLAVLMQQHGADYVVDARQSSRPLTEKEREKLTVYLPLFMRAIAEHIRTHILDADHTGQTPELMTEHSTTFHNAE